MKKKSTNITRNKRIKIASAIIGASVITAGAGIGIGYAIFHKKHAYVEGNPEITEIYSQPVTEHYSIEGSKPNDIEFSISDTYKNSYGEDQITINPQTGDLSWVKELDIGQYDFTVSTNSGKINSLDVTLNIIKEPGHIVGDPHVYTHYTVSSTTDTQEKYYAVSSSGKPITNRTWKIKQITGENFDAGITIGASTTEDGVGILQWTNTLEVGEYTFNVEYDGGTHHIIEPYKVILTVGKASSYVSGIADIHSVLGAAVSERYIARDMDGESIYDSEDQTSQYYDIDWGDNPVSDKIHLDRHSGVLTYDDDLPSDTTYKFKITYDDQKNYSTAPLPVTIIVSDLYVFPLSPSNLTDYFVLTDDNHTIYSWLADGKDKFNADCSGYNAISFDSSITKINDSIFYDFFPENSPIKVVDIPYVLTIGSNAFARNAGNIYNRNTSITRFNLSETSPITIGSGAFNGCTNATIPLGINIGTIGNAAFFGWTKLTATMVDAAQYNDTTHKMVENGTEPITGAALLFLNGSSLAGVAGGFAAGNLGLWSKYYDSGTTQLDTKFEHLSSITAIDLTDCPKIVAYSFDGCSSLTTVTGDTINPTSITGDGSFKACTNLSSISANAFKFEIDEEGNDASGSFFGCTNLMSITMNDPDHIPNSTFENCSSLGRVIMQNASRVGNYAFKNCTSLTRINIKTLVDSGSDIAVGITAFDGCKNLKRIHITEWSSSTDDHHTFSAVDYAGNPASPFRNTTGGGVVWSSTNQTDAQTLSGLINATWNVEGVPPPTSWSFWTGEHDT